MALTNDQLLARIEALENVTAGVKTKTNTTNTTLASLQTAVTALQSIVTQLQEGIFTNVSGSTVRITGSGGGTLYIPALNNFVNQVNTALLNGVEEQARPPTVATAPPSGGYTNAWGLNTQNVLNSIIASLENMGLMS
jgi:hypothetical protein